MSYYETVRGPCNPPVDRSGGPEHVKDLDSKVGKLEWEVRSLGKQILKCLADIARLEGAANAQHTAQQGAIETLHKRCDAVQSRLHKVVAAGAAVVCIGAVAAVVMAAAARRRAIRTSRLGLNADSRADSHTDSHAAVQADNEHKDQEGVTSTRIKRDNE
jgi:hypothetical protein